MKKITRQQARFLKEYHDLDNWRLDKMKVARKIGVNRATIYNHLKRFGLEGDINKDDAKRLIEQFEASRKTRKKMVSDYEVQDGDEV